MKLLELIKTCTDIELVKLQHELRQHEEDKEYLEAVLRELSKRGKEKTK